MDEQDFASLLVECLEQLEEDWRTIDNEWGPVKDGLEGAIARGNETLIPRVRAAIIQLASTGVRHG